MSVKTNELQRIEDSKKVSDLLVESNELGTGRYSANILNTPITWGQLNYGMGWTPEAPIIEESEV